jgi:RNA polymerase sigma-70 factor (ECF subfamily)
MCPLADAVPGMSDSGRFEAFVRTHQHMVYATALRLLGRPADAEDIAQAVFLKAFEHFDRLTTSENPAAWLRTVTRHDSLNHLSRYRARWRFFSELESGDESAPLNAVAPGEPVTDTLDRTRQQEQLSRAIAALPDHQRVPLVLFHFEEMSYLEIAATLQVSVAKIKTDIHRARLALKRHLGNVHV